MVGFFSLIFERLVPSITYNLTFHLGMSSFIKQVAVLNLTLPPSIHNLIMHRDMSRSITQCEAVHINSELINEYKFGNGQLLELSGLSCAHAIYNCYCEEERVLVCCGPGSNGGDGLVCARNLKHFGFCPTIYYPKEMENELFSDLLNQCACLDIPIIKTPLNALEIDNKFDLVVDALFGHSFKPPIREFWEPIMESFKLTKKPIASIDVPSGWNVDWGNLNCVFEPEMLISIIAPKLCSLGYVGKHHYLTGRFVPACLAIKYCLDLPSFPAKDICVSLS